MKPNPDCTSKQNSSHLSKKKKKRKLVTSSDNTKCDSNWKKLRQEIPSSTQKKRTDGHKKVEPSQRKSSPIWFDDVPKEEILLAEGISLESENDLSKTEKQLVKNKAYGGITKAIGMDCEMVGTGKRGMHSVLARVSLVNQYGKRIYDKHVKVDENITDYRTWVSGIQPSDLKGAEEFSVVQREVAEILKDRILVGHALQNDLRALYLNHPKRLIRDTASYPPFLVHNKGRTPSLKVLTAKLLGVQVQTGEHSSVQDAQAAMKIYMLHKRQWEKEIKSKKKKK